MRILVIGAGSLGGYFGGRLHASGRDVTFLVREARARILRERGLTIRSSAGDLHIEHPQLIMAPEIQSPFDLILLGCKAYDLDDAISSFAPAVGPHTIIVPLLNGMRHLECLDAAFGRSRVFGGASMISTTLDQEGSVIHMGELQSLIFGPRTANPDVLPNAVLAALSGASFDVQLSSQAEQDMWQKWVFIAASAGITSLMRGSVGDIVEGGGVALAEQLVEECSAIAAANGFEPSGESKTRTLSLLTSAGSPLTASMLRDIEAGNRIEADHIIGDLVRRCPETAAVPLLRTVLAGLKDIRSPPGTSERQALKVRNTEVRWPTSDHVCARQWRGYAPIEARINAVAESSRCQICLGYESR